MAPLDRITGSLQPLRDQLLSHPLYPAIQTPRELRIFMEHHVFAVWDFMSLVKAAQRRLTCVDVPWTPRADRANSRFLNEIVLGEESDDDGRGGYISHFELYLEAMRQAGARTDRIEAVLRGLSRGESVGEALEFAEAPASARRFVLSTFRTIASGSLPAIVSAFTLGREDVIPSMFRTLVSGLDARSPGSFTLLRQYLERHVDLDETRHAPMARALLSSVCGDSPASWADAETSARLAIQARIGFWDDVVRAFG